VRFAIERSCLSALAIVAILIAPLAHAQDVQERPDLETVLRQESVSGTFTLYEVGAGRITAVNRARAEQRFVPASTFKIANSLIALETAVVKDESEVIPYGGKPQPFKAWERDMGLRDAIKISNVPIYQELARRVGIERYRFWLERLDYGNREPGTVVDRFWLDGPLAISAVEQVKFIARLAQQQLPLSTRSQSIVTDILRLERRDGAVLYGKTGWQSPIGWWVGWVERSGKVSAFALNIDMASSQDAPKRLSVGKALLAKLKVL